MSNHNFFNEMLDDLEEASKDKKRIGKILSNHKKIVNECKNRKYKCSIESCDETAIKSHTLQKNGILNRIADNGHLYQFGFDMFRTPQPLFKPIGINDALTFKGFCSTHDDSIFKSIESDEPDLNDYKTQLLFTYRSVVNETWKKYLALDINISTTKHPQFVPNESTFSMMKVFIDLNLGIRDNLKLIEEIKEEIKTGNSNNFLFHHIIIEEEMLPICASGVFTIETLKEMEKLEEKYGWDFPLNNVFFNVIPFNNKTSVLIGCKRDASLKCVNYVNTFSRKRKNSLKKAISDVLISVIESWVLSPSFYKKLVEHEERITKTFFRTHELKEHNFNIFDY